MMGAIGQHASGLVGSLRSRGGWLLLAGQLGPKVATTATVLVSSALLGPDGRGQLAFVMATASLVSAIAVFGLFVPASRADPPVPWQYVHLIALLAVVADVLLVVVALIAPRGLLTPGFALLIAVNTLALAVVVFAQHVLQVRVSDREYFLFGAIWPLAINAVLVVLLFAGIGVPGFLITWSALNVVWAMWALLRLASKVQLRLVRPYRARSYLVAAAPFGVAFVAASLATRGDITVLGVASSEYEVGQYSLATSIAALLFLVSQVFTLRAAAIHKSTAAADYPAAVRRLALMAVLAVAVLSIPLIALAWGAVHLLLPEFVPALLPMVVLCVAALPETYARVHSWALGMTGNTPRLLGYASVSAVVFASYFFAAHWGAIGVAIASLIGYTLQALVVSYRVRWQSADGVDRAGLQ